MEKSEPAFPTIEITHIAGQDVVSRQSGMTLRDYFAAKAMQGMLATMDFSNKNNTKGLLANQAYEIASAMLKERTNVQPQKFTPEQSDWIRGWNCAGVLIIGKKEPS